MPKFSEISGRREMERFIKYFTPWLVGLGRQNMPFSAQHKLFWILGTGLVRNKNHQPTREIHQPPPKKKKTNKQTNKKDKKPKRSILPSINVSHGHVHFQLGCKFILHIFFPLWYNMSSVEECNSAWGLSTAGRFLKGCSMLKTLEIFFICLEIDKLKMADQGWLHPRSLLSYMEARAKGLFQDGIGFATRTYGERFPTNMDCKSSGLNYSSCGNQHLMKLSQKPTQVVELQ